MSVARPILWRRLDRLGLEYARLERHPDQWRIAGTVLVKDDERPCALQYEVICDGTWAAREARVTGVMGIERVDVHLESAGGRWRRNGVEQRAVDGCVDVDLAFTPATNTLPIRRLALEVGASAPVVAAWLRFPELDLVTLEQSYRRESESTYRYESHGGAFVAELEVDDVGLVRRYGDLWIAD